MNANQAIGILMETLQPAEPFTPRTLASMKNQIQTARAMFNKEEYPDYLHRARLAKIKTP